jgi:hypothetical protein
MSGSRVKLLSALAVVLAVALAPSAGSAPSQTPTPDLVIPCGFSHRNHDDPIALPRQRGRSHDHTFFGNRSTNAFSTPASLRSDRRTTCGLQSDTAAYWAPTLFVDKRPVRPVVMVATYSRRTAAPIAPFPAGLKMIAGDATARRPQSTDVTYWGCARVPDRKWSTIPRCPGSRAGLQLNVVFPNCWDGKRLDSLNHQVHMEYSSNGVCPGSHPIDVPSLTLQISYSIAGGAKAQLASGVFGGHADFINAWDQGTFTGLVDRYFNGRA